LLKVSRKQFDAFLRISLLYCCDANASLLTKNKRKKLHPSYYNDHHFKGNTVLVSDLLLTFIPINREFDTQFVRAFGVIFVLIASKEFFLDSNFINNSSFLALSK